MLPYSFFAIIITMNYLYNDNIYDDITISNEFIAILDAQVQQAPIFDNLDSPIAQISTE